MTRRALSLEIAAVTLIALAITFWWALDPIFIAIFMMVHSGTADAELIRQSWHFRLVQPEWILDPNQSLQFLRWQHAEACARLAVVFAGWIGSVAALTRRYRRHKRRHLTKRCSERLAVAAPHFP
jgi:hypothetical protein